VVINFSALGFAPRHVESSYFNSKLSTLKHTPRHEVDA
ncbi:MAG: hypothetical protein ACI8W7_004347, partial [Gammaproteobacteria bacterium]